MNIYGDDPCFHKTCFLLLTPNAITSYSDTDMDYHYAETVHSEFRLDTVWNLYGTSTVMRTYTLVLHETSQTSYLEKLKQAKIVLFFNTYRASFLALHSLPLNVHKEPCGV